MYWAVMAFPVHDVIVILSEDSNQLRKQHSLFKQTLYGSSLTKFSSWIFTNFYSRPNIFVIWHFYYFFISLVIILNIFTVHKIEVHVFLFVHDKCCPMCNSSNKKDKNLLLRLVLELAYFFMELFDLILCAMQKTKRMFNRGNLNWNTSSIVLYFL